MDPPPLLRAEARAASALILLAALFLCAWPPGPRGPLEFRPVRVDVNRARLDELTVLPGVGLKTAAQMVASRPHRDWTRLRAILGPKRWGRLRSYLTLGPEAERDLNLRGSGG